jgi:chromosome segregation ATPase
MALTHEQIWKTADELNAGGVKPTLAAVRKAIGSGSYTTISEALKEWRQQKEQVDRVDEVVVPDAVKSVVLDAGKAIWQAALETSREEVEGMRSSLKEREEELSKESAEALALADQMSNEAEQSKAEIKQLEESMIEAETQAKEAEAVAEEREKRIRSLEEDKEALQEQLGKTKEEYKRQFQKFTDCEKVNADLRIENARLQERFENSEQRAKELAAQVEALQGQLAGLAGAK